MQEHIGAAAHELRKARDEYAQCLMVDHTGERPDVAAPASALHRLQDHASRDERREREQQRNEQASNVFGLG